MNEKWERPVRLLAVGAVLIALTAALSWVFRPEPEDGAPLSENDFILLEYVQYNPALTPKPRTLAVTLPGRRVLLSEDGRLFMYTDDADTVDALSSNVGGIQSDLSG